MHDNTYSPADIIVYIPGQGIVLKEVALINGISPFHLGKIVDFENATHIMRQVFLKVFGRTLRKPEVVVCHSKEYTYVDEKACIEMILTVGAKGVYMYAGSLEEFLQNTEEKEVQRYKGIIAITKEEPLEYIREMAKEAIDFVKEYGMSKEQFVDIIKEI